jgi:hypothetical protein
LDIRSEPAQAIDKRGRVIRGAGADADRRLHRHAGGAAGAGARAADIAGSLDLASFGDFFLQGSRHGNKRYEKFGEFTRVLLEENRRKFVLEKAGSSLKFKVTARRCIVTIQT